MLANADNNVVALSTGDTPGPGVHPPNRYPLERRRVEKSRTKVDWLGCQGTKIPQAPEALERSEDARCIDSLSIILIFRLFLPARSGTET